MGDFLRFETMITPAVIQVIFWLAVIFCIITGIVIMVMADTGLGRLGGVLLLILGPIVSRIYAEILIIFFRINDHLRAIQHNTSRV